MTTARPPSAMHWTAHVRAGALFVLITVLVVGLAYPAFVSVVARTLDPYAADGSLLRCPDGTVVGSADLAQNFSAGALGPSLFWARPSPSDYNQTLGVAALPGPTEPALLKLLNETLAYLRGGTSNSSPTAPLPFWWVAPSASGADPDLTPAAVLVQVPRVANATGLGVPAVLALVNGHITEPPLPFLGVPFVNVLELDLAVLAAQGKC